MCIYAIYEDEWILLFTKGFPYFFCNTLFHRLYNLKKLFVHNFYDIQKNLAIKVKDINRNMLHVFAKYLRKYKGYNCHFMTYKSPNHVLTESIWQTHSPLPYCPGKEKIHTKNLNSLLSHHHFTSYFIFFWSW